jgi:nitrous oxidase accessory protein
MLTEAGGFNIRVPGDVRTLHEALKKANPYDTILVDGGTYAEGNLLIDKPLVLLGVNNPVIDGKFKVETISIKSSHVTVQGFRIINTGYSSMDDMAAISVNTARHVHITNNILENTFFGIHFTNSTHCLVANNNIHGPVGRVQNDVGNGIHFWKCSFNRILNNEISGHRDGIYFEFVRNTVIANNKSHNNLRYGLHFMFSDSDNYYRNVFTNNGSGVAVMYSRYVNMLENTFDHNWGGSAYGLLLKDIRDSQISGNLFRKNTVGIHMEGCSRSLIYKNTLTENGYAIRMQADCDDNRLSFNSFLVNTFDMITNGNTVLNSIRYNYWDRYAGYDMQRDGIGDQPYHPMNLFSSIVEQNPVTVIFLKSFLAELLDTLEKLIPGITPENLIDSKPLMKQYA